MRVDIERSTKRPTAMSLHAQSDIIEFLKTPRKKRAKMVMVIVIVRQKWTRGLERKGKTIEQGEMCSVAMRWILLLGEKKKAQKRRVKKDVNERLMIIIPCLALSTSMNGAFTDSQRET